MAEQHFGGHIGSMMKQIPCFFLLLVALAFPGSLTAQGPSAESELSLIHI